MKSILIPELKELKMLGGSIEIRNYSLTKEFMRVVPVSEDLWRDIGDGKGEKPVELHLDIQYSEEEYTLTLTLQSISVRASTPKGAYYALCTLVQLSQLNHGNLECCEIHDWPGIKVRGISDDISRGQISTLENFKLIIKRLSQYKCNVYLPYIEDTFAYRCLPQSGKFSDPVAAAEWLELVKYASEYYIKIIPIINIFGHWDKNSVLEAFADNMLREGNLPNGLPMGALDVRKSEVRTNVCNMLDEVVEVFGQAGIIHVGGDEVLELTKTFSKEESTLIYNGYYKFIQTELFKRGCKMWMYSDMYTPIWGDYQLQLEDIDEMPQDIGFVYWDYSVREEYPNINELIKRRRHIYISPATYTWSRFLPHFEVSWYNIQRLSGFKPEQYEGIITSAWCDGGMNLREENWFGILAGALFGWEPGSRMTLNDFIIQFFEVYYGLEHINLQFFHQLFDYHQSFIPDTSDEAISTKPMEVWYQGMQEVGRNLYNEFWKDARLPVDDILQSHAKGMPEQIVQAQSYFEGLRPLRNNITYETMLFDIKRLHTNIRKIKLLKSGAYRTREEAMADIPVILDLAKEVASLRKENKKLWFAANRQSEWEFCESKYLDLEASLRSLARYCKVAKVFKREKFL